MSEPIPRISGRLHVQHMPSHPTAANSDTQSERAFAESILATIGNLTQRCGRPPTYREVLAELDLRSHRRLSNALEVLVVSGRLHRLTGSRNLIVVPKSPAGEHE